MAPNNRKHCHTEPSASRILVSIRDSSTSSKTLNSRVRIMFMLLMVLSRKLIAHSLRRAYALRSLNYHSITLQKKAKVVP
jgi:hypothetical protein